MDAAQFARWLDRRKLPILLVWTVLYFAVTIALARHRPFWYDELYTYYLVGLPALADIQTALALTIDYQPFAFYAVTRAAARLASDPHIGLRLPQILGFWVMSLGVFHFVARRQGALYGFLAMLGPLTTSAYPYAMEARPYGMVLGCCGVALVAWQASTEGGRRLPVLILLTVSIAGAISSNYYAVLLLIPLAAGELVRTRTRRSVDWSIWLTLALGSSVCFFYWPLMSRGVAELSRGPLPTRLEIFYLYNRLLDSPTLAWVALAPILAFWRLRSDPEPEAPALPRHELAAALGLLLLPVLGYLAARFGTHIFYSRYILSTVAGFGIVTAAAVRRRPTAALLLLVWAAYIPLRQAISYRDEFVLRRSPIDGPQRLLAAYASDLPVAVDSAVRFLPLYHYSGPALRSRLHHASLGPPDPLGALQRWDLRFPVHTYQDFRRAHRRFLLCAFTGDLGPALPAALTDGSSVRLVAAEGAGVLYLIGD